MNPSDTQLVSPELVAQPAIVHALENCIDVIPNGSGQSPPVPSVAAIVGAIQQGFGEIAKSILDSQVPTIQPKALSAEQAAEYLGIKSTTLEYLVKVRRIRYVQVCDQRGRVFRIEDLDDFLQANTQLTASELLQKRGRR